MKSNVLLAVVAIAFAASTGACVWLIRAYFPDVEPIHIFIEASPVAKLCMFAAIFAFVPTLIGALIPSRSMAYVGAGVASGFGALGALYGEMITRTAIRMTNTTNFDVTAPGRAESLFCLSLGLFVALVALVVLKLRGR